MDRDYAVALVWAWLAEHPEYYNSWVNAHTQMRWSAEHKRMMVTRVGGHWRAQALWRDVMPSLRSVCKFEQLVKPALMDPKPEVGRSFESGWVPRRYRALVFV